MLPPFTQIKCKVILAFIRIKVYIIIVNINTPAEESCIKLLIFLIFKNSFLLMKNAGVSYSNNVGLMVSFAQNVAVNAILLLKLEDSSIIEIFMTKKGI